MKRLSIFVFLLVLAGALIFSSCAKSEQSPAAGTPTTPVATANAAPAVKTTETKTQSPKSGGVLTIIASPPSKLGDPRQMGAAGRFDQVPALETLARFDNNHNLVPWLADSWTLDSQTKTLTVKLKQGIKFHDNTDFNAAAVKFTWDLFIATHQSQTTKLKSVDVIDDYTVRANLSDWDNSIDYQLLISAGVIVSPTAWQTRGEEWASMNPVGTGPFKFVSWEQGVKLTYQKWDGYWQKGKPYLDGIQMLFIDDQNSRLNSFLAKEGDILNWAIPSNAKLLESKGYSLSKNPSGIDSAVWGFFPDVGKSTPSPFADVRVRKAVEYAIDKQALIDAVYEGYGTITYESVPAGTQYYYDKMETRKYDPNKAKQLLAEAAAAGVFKPNAQGGFDTVLFGDTSGKKVLEVVQPMLDAVGIKGTVQVSTVDGMFEKVIGGGWNGLIYGAIQIQKDPMSTAVNDFTLKAPLYPSTYKTQAFDDAIFASLTATDPDTKMAANNKAMDLLFNQNAVMIPVVSVISPSVKQPYIHNDNINELSMTLWTPEDAWLDK